MCVQVLGFFSHDFLLFSYLFFSWAHTIHTIFSCTYVISSNHNISHTISNDIFSYTHTILKKIRCRMKIGNHIWYIMFYLDFPSPIYSDLYARTVHEWLLLIYRDLKCRITSTEYYVHQQHLLTIFTNSRNNSAPHASKMYLSQYPGQKQTRNKLTRTGAPQSIDQYWFGYGYPDKSTQRFVRRDRL